MISRIARLKAKKGFTIIELVVVIAIIGVLTAIVVSAMSYNQKPTLGKGVAKDVYYVAQDAFASAKISEPLAMEAALSGYEKFGFYVDIDKYGNITDSDGNIKNWGALYVGADTAGAMPGIVSKVKSYNAVTGGTAEEVTQKTEQLKKMGERVLGALKTYLESLSNMDGTLIVIADKNYRVLAAYWTDQTIEDDGTFKFSGSGMFTDNNMLDSGMYCSAYPARCSVAGHYVFNTK